MPRGRPGMREDRMIDDEDGRPRPLRQKVKLDSMSVAELEAHIAELKLELDEARRMVEAKRSYRSSLDDLFGS